MLSVVVPLLVLFAITLIKKIPKIGGNVAIGLIAAGLLAMLMGKMFNPVSWIYAWVDGLDRLAWVMALSLMGSFYGETQGEIGALDTVVDFFRSLFARSARGLVVAVILAIAVGGEAFGDAIASASVIGVLVIPALAGVGLSGERISATIIFGCMLGSIMPPISQAVALSGSIVSLTTEQADLATNLTFITSGIAFVICGAIAAFHFVKIKEVPEELVPKERPLQIIKRGWKGLLPFFLIVVLIVVNAVVKDKTDLNLYQHAFGSLYEKMSQIKIVRGLTNTIVITLFIASIITFIFKNVRQNTGRILKDGFINVLPSLSIQASAALFVGALYAGGQIDIVTEFAKGLDDSVVKVGGGITLLVIAMLTGSQTTAQNAIFTFLGPILVSIGVNPVNAVMAGSHIASAGQALPPSNLTAFVVASMVGSTLGKKVDPVKSMIEALPMSICLGVCGFAFLFM